MNKRLRSKKAWEDFRADMLGIPTSTAGPMQRWPEARQDSGKMDAFMRVVREA